MKTYAALMTSKGIGAIGIIQLIGDLAQEIIEKIFTPAGTKKPIYKTGSIHLGIIADGKRNIDQVTLGIEGENNFAINCHGNALIVSDIMTVLKQSGVVLIDADKMLSIILDKETDKNSIAIEAAVAFTKAKTLEGSMIINNQIDSGLSQTATQWLEENNLEIIKTQAQKVLSNSATADYIINGFKAAIIGPPNSGKSTLLNALAGKQKAIVTDIKGTTRDWVSAECMIGPACIEFIDTAGLDEQPAKAIGEIDTQSQLKSNQMLESADIILFIIDGSEKDQLLDKETLKKVAEKKTITILNKSDLGIEFDKQKLPKDLQKTVEISAQNSIGLDMLIEVMLEITGISDFKSDSPVSFTCRQQNHLKNLTKAKTIKQANSIITELLNGKICV